jgi:hypothetical protein
MNVEVEDGVEAMMNGGAGADAEGANLIVDQ